MFGILLHAIVKNGKYLASIMDDSAIMCDEIIEADAEAKSYDEETKNIPKNKNRKLLYFTCLFIYYNCIIDSC